VKEVCSNTGRRVAPAYVMISWDVVEAYSNAKEYVAKLGDVTRASSCYDFPECCKKACSKAGRRIALAHITTFWDVVKEASSNTGSVSRQLMFRRSGML